VVARWHAPVHCRHIRRGVMAFFSAYGRRTICARAYVYDRISTGETKSISGTVRVRPPVRPSASERARFQTAPRGKLIVREACASTLAMHCAKRKKTRGRKTHSCLLDTLDGAVFPPVMSRFPRKRGLCLPLSSRRVECCYFFVGNGTETCALFDLRCFSNASSVSE
jgi:hypothetical protein